MALCFVAPFLSPSASAVAVPTSSLGRSRTESSRCHRLKASSSLSSSLSASTFTSAPHARLHSRVRHPPNTSQLFPVVCSSASVGRGESADEGNAVKRELSLEVKELRSVLKKCSVYLVGPMGSGKSAIGRYLARELGFHFLDTDELIENLMKKKVSEIFEESGEDEFRDIESRVLEQTASFIGCVVATGGGIVIRKENWGSLQTGIVVYLNTSVDILYHRLSRNDGDGDEIQHRPLLSSAKDPDELRDRIEQLLKDRDHMYRQADICINVSNEASAVDDVTKELIRVLTNFIKANPPKLSKLFPGGEQFKK